MPFWEFYTELKITFGKSNRAVPSYCELRSHAAILPSLFSTSLTVVRLHGVVFDRHNNFHDGCDHGIVRSSRGAICCQLTTTWSGITALLALHTTQSFYLRHDSSMTYCGARLLARTRRAEHSSTDIRDGSGSCRHRASPPSPSSIDLLSTWRQCVVRRRWHQMCRGRAGPPCTPRAHR